MQRLLIIPLAASLAVAQKIEIRKPDSTGIMRLATATNHLSVIEVREPIVQVAAGSSSFKVEWRENKVFVTPLEPEAQTNLFIWTESERHTYELVSTSRIEDAVFAVDHQPVTKVTRAPDPPAAPAAEQSRIPPEMLLKATSVTLSGRAKNHQNVQALLKDLFRKDGKVFVRYALVNNGRSTYRAGVPDVVQLKLPKSPTSLIPLVNAQLADTSGLAYQGEVPIKIVQAESPESVPPGATAYGIVAFESPQALGSSERVVVLFDFPRDAKDEVNAVLVM